MSIKDLIWVNVAQGIKLKRTNDAEIEKTKFCMEPVETVYLTLCDLRDLLLDIDFYTKAAAMKGTKGKISSFDTKKLTSVRVQKEKEEKEMMAKMTPEEIAEFELQKLLAGEILE